MDEEISQKQKELIELEEIEEDLDNQVQNLEKLDQNQQQLVTKENQLLTRYQYLLNKFNNKSEAYRFKLEIFLQYKKIKDKGYETVKKIEILVHRLEKINITLSYLEEKYKTFKENEALLYLKVQNEKKNLEMYIPNKDVHRQYPNSSFNYSVILNFARVQKSRKVSLLYDTKSYFLFLSRFESDKKFYTIKQKNFDPNEKFITDISERPISHLLTLNIFNKLVIIAGTCSYYLDVESGKVISFNNNIEENHLFGSLMYLVNHHMILCVSGKFTEKCETMSLPDLKLEPELTWSKTEPLTKPRAHCCTFVVNGSEVYILFGYNYSEESYADYIEKINFDSPKKNWAKINIKSSPFCKNVLSGTISITNNMFYIYGGIIDGKINNNIYSFHIDKNTIELTKLTTNKKSDQSISFSNPDFWKESSLSELMFFNESTFIPMSPEENIKKSLFNFVLYDNKSIYLLNILNNSQVLFNLNNYIKEKKDLNDISEISENSNSSQEIDEEINENIQSNDMVIKSFQFDKSNQH